MNILQLKKYYLLIKVKSLKKNKSTYFHLQKAFAQQIKTIKDQGKKHSEAWQSAERQKLILIEDTNSKDQKLIKLKKMKYNEIKEELNKINTI